MRHFSAWSVVLLCLVLIGACPALVQAQATPGATNTAKGGTGAPTTPSTPSAVAVPPASSAPATPASSSPPAAGAAAMPDDVTNKKPEYTQIEVDILQSLSHRRAELDDREHAIASKEKVLETLQSKVETKITELKSLKEEVSALLAQYNDKHNEQLDSLVKVYETMKPTDAAKIFGQMRLSILLEIITRMKEKKLAPILAKMDTDKAKTITSYMAEERKLAPEEQ